MVDDLHRPAVGFGNDIRPQHLFRRPQGLDLPFDQQGERGYRLCGGEKQRIALARRILCLTKPVVYPALLTAVQDGAGWNLDNLLTGK